MQQANQEEQQVKNNFTGNLLYEENVGFIPGTLKLLGVSATRSMYLQDFAKITKTLILRMKIHEKCLSRVVRSSQSTLRFINIQTE